MSRLPLACGLATACILGLSLHLVFVAPSGGAAGPLVRDARLASAPLWRAAAADEPLVQEAASAWSSAVRFLAGAALGVAVLLGASAGPAHADIEDVAIPVDGKGKTA